MTAPPNYIPSKLENQNNLSVKDVIGKYAFIWLKDKSQFWCWITFSVVERIGGWRYNGYFWDNFEINTEKIQYIIVYS